VHMGRHGIYYRATLPPSRVPKPTDISRPGPAVPPHTHDPLTDIESADVGRIVDSSSAELLKELNDKRRRVRLWPVSLGVVGVLLITGLAAEWPGWLLAAIVAAGAIATYAAYQRGLLRKTAVLFYELEPDVEQ